MSLESGPPSLASRLISLSETADEGDSLVEAIARQVSLPRAAALLGSGLAQILESPLAVLSGDALAWRFEAEGFPGGRSESRTPRPLTIPAGTDPAEQWRGQQNEAWTGIGLGHAGGREWLLLAPGTSATWASRPGFDALIERVGWSLGQVARREDDDRARRFARRVHAFGQRLARAADGEMHALVLRTLATEVRARTGAIAAFCEADQGLAIVATHGYPPPSSSTSASRPERASSARPINPAARFWAAPRTRAIPAGCGTGPVPSWAFPFRRRAGLWRSSR